MDNEMGRETRVENLEKLTQIHTVQGSVYIENAGGEGQSRRARRPWETLEAPPYMAPAPAEAIIGREDILTLIQGRLLQRRSVALSGLPGVGKTTVAVHLANLPEVKAHFKDGILWAGLGRHPDTLKLLGDWAIALGYSVEQVACLNTIESRRSTVRMALANRQALLIIDDAWDLMAAQTFKLGGNLCTHLITTRRPEVAVEFSDESPEAVRDEMIHELDESQGRILLETLAPEVVRAEQAKANTLVRNVGGLPLALTIMGRYLRKESYNQQPRRIQEALDRLLKTKERLNLTHLPIAERQPGLPHDIPISLLAVIGVSDDALDAEARETLRALSAFPAKPVTFSEEAALATSGTSTVALNVLSDQGLLEPSGAGRYTLHQTIADYGCAMQTDPAASVRMTQFFMWYVKNNRSNYSALEQEHANILAALASCYGRGQKSEDDMGRAEHWTLFVAAVDDLADYLWARGYWRERVDLCKQAFAACWQIANWEGAGRQAYAIGWVFVEQDNLDMAQDWSKKCLSAMTLAETQEGLSLAKHLMGLIALRKCEYGRAETCFQEALASTSPTRTGVGGKSSIMSELGHLHRYQGKLHDARAWYERCIAENEHTGFIEGIGISKGYLASTLYALGEVEQAESLYREALRIIQNIGRATTIARIHIGLAELLMQTGNVEEARIHARESLPIYEHLDKKEEVARVRALLERAGIG